MVCNFGKERVKAEVQAATNIMGEEMPGLDEGIIGLGLTTDSKSLQEACQVGNQPKDKGTAVDTAVLKRSVDMNTHASSQETSRHGHPQYWVDTKRIPGSQFLKSELLLILLSSSAAR